MKKGRSSLGANSQQSSSGNPSKPADMHLQSANQPGRAPPASGRLSLNALKNVAKNQRNAQTPGQTTSTNPIQPPTPLLEKQIKAAEKAEKKAFQPKRTLPEVDPRLQLISLGDGILPLKFHKYLHQVDPDSSPYPSIGLSLHDLNRFGMIAGDIISLSILLPKVDGRNSDEGAIGDPFHTPNAAAETKHGFMTPSPAKTKGLSSASSFTSPTMSTPSTMHTFSTPLKNRGGLQTPSQRGAFDPQACDEYHLSLCQVHTSPAYVQGTIRFCYKFKALAPAFDMILQHHLPTFRDSFVADSVDSLAKFFTTQYYTVKKCTYMASMTPFSSQPLSAVTFAPLTLSRPTTVSNQSKELNHSTQNINDNTDPFPQLYTQFTSSLLTRIRQQYPLTLTTPLSQSLCGQYVCFVPVSYSTTVDPSHIHHVQFPLNTMSTSPHPTLYHCTPTTKIEVLPALPPWFTTRGASPIPEGSNSKDEEYASSKQTCISDPEGVSSPIPHDSEPTVYDDPEHPQAHSSQGSPAAQAPHETYNPDDDIGGLDNEMHVLRETLELPLLQPGLFAAFGLKPPRGVLLHGPPGCGKTLLASWFSKVTSASFLQVSASAIVASGGANYIQQLFTKALRQAPCIVFIDEIDALCSDNATVCALLSILDGGYDTSQRANVCILGATNRVKALPPALRRPGRFDVELHVTTPNIRGRTAILEKKMKKLQHSMSKEQVIQIAEWCNGFVGADIDLLISEAVAHSLIRSYSTDLQDNEMMGAEDLHHTRDHPEPLFAQPSPSQVNHLVSVEDFRYALRLVRPSGIRDISSISIAESEVGGHEEIKKRLEEAFEWPLRHRQLVERLGARKSSGILLYGPPGCAKTLLAKSVCARSKRTFLCVKGPELFSKYVGDSEKAVRSVFQRARACAPCILFLDEVDSFGSSRGGGDATDRVVSQLLIELDGVNDRGDVCVLAATNRPDLVDKALLRSGRLDRALYVGPPDLHDTKEILQLQLGRISTHQSVADALDSLAQACYAKRYTGAELTAVCRDAAVRALTTHIQSIEQTKSLEQVTHDDISHFTIDDLVGENVGPTHDEPVCVKLEHIHAAIQETKPRISQSTIQFYLDYQRNNGLTNL